MSVLGENIKRIRTSRGCTITKLSNLANVGMSTISQIETGKRKNLQTDILIKIAKALNVDTTTLTEPKKECDVANLSDELSYILSSNKISIDGEEMTEIEKNNFKSAIEVIINIIKEKRNVNN